jgi:hypothetical protein
MANAVEMNVFYTWLEGVSTSTIRLKSRERKIGLGFVGREPRPLLAKLSSHETFSCSETSGIRRISLVFKVYDAKT